MSNPLKIAQQRYRWVIYALTERFDRFFNGWRTVNAYVLTFDRCLIWSLTSLKSERTLYAKWLITTIHSYEWPNAFIAEIVTVVKIRLILWQSIIMRHPCCSGLMKVKSMLIPDIWQSYVKQGYECGSQHTCNKKRRYLQYYQ